MRSLSPAATSMPEHSECSRPAEQGPIPALDLVRFTAAIMVMLFHLCYWGNGATPAAADTFNNFWWFGWVGVEIFFTLSGFVIVFSAKKASAAKFAVGRLTRLFPTIWLCATLTLLLTLALSPRSNLGELGQSYLNTLWMNPKGGHIDIVYWTLTVEIAFYFLVCVLLYLRDFSFLLKALLVVGTVSALFNTAIFFIDAVSHLSPALAEMLKKINGMHTFRLLLVKHGVFFAIGALLWKRSSVGRSAGADAMLILLCVGASLEVWAEGTLHAHHLGDPTASVSLVLVIWLLGLFSIAFGSTDRVTRCINAWLPPGLVRQLGLLTFPLYLLHNNGGLLLKDALRVQGVANNTATLLSVTAILLMATVIARHAEPPLAQWLKTRLQPFVCHP